MLRLDPPLPVLIRREGAWRNGMAHVLLDYGYEHDLCWVVFEDDSRECWTARNRDVRAQDNVTAGRAQDNNAVVTGPPGNPLAFDPLRYPQSTSGGPYRSPTVVDELVVSLSLDSTEFEKQCRKVLAGAQNFKAALAYMMD